MPSKTLCIHTNIKRIYPDLKMLTSLVDNVVPCREHFILFYIITFYIFNVCW